jgi:MGT family glycosyltransferase
MALACVLGHPAAGHINPNLPLMEELCRRGERVVYYATEPFRARVERTGSEFRSYGAHELFERSLGAGGMLGGMAGLIETTAQILPALAAQLRAMQPDYLLVEAHAVWGNLLAQMLDVPTATLCSMFAMNESLISAAGLMNHLYGAAPRELALDGLLALGEYFEAARRLQRRFSVVTPGIVDYLGNRQSLNLVFTSREFQIRGSVFDESYRFVGPSIANRQDYQDFPLQRIAGQEPILISMGTMYNDEAEFYRDCFQAFANWPDTFVLAVGHRVDRTQFGDPPANFVVCEYVPQVALLETARLFITHGGINSAHEAMLHGVPMVVLPQRADHYVVAGQVEAAGAGVVLDRSMATPERLENAARQALADPLFRTRSARMGETLRAAGGHHRAADEIFEFRRSVSHTCTVS